MALEKESVCITGAGGYLASWVVKFLLSKDYFIHGTVRDPNLILFASDNQSQSQVLVELIEPAVKGTFNVMKACHEAKVKRVIVVSSLASVALNPNWPEGQVMDETCWSDKEYCRTSKNWYYLSKTESESEALDYGKSNGLDLVTLHRGRGVNVGFGEVAEAGLELPVLGGNPH
ncbi:hypothetical protein Dsin_003978 [Dipteronia sinensis]|uniref:NAD-dependent epimerase/dehydratase domain-containing protein n=1 Tax=Dipteronia sinensis TaxID=43782 RepID=A0AAE0B938_9ROSI|nr:hypothetical protein Dsin_003978 [Dipteronia sinensis]